MCQGRALSVIRCLVSNKVVDNGAGIITVRQLSYKMDVALWVKSS